MTATMLVSEDTIAQLYGEPDELRKAIITAQMAVRAKELDIEAQFKSVISAANKADKKLADEYSRDYARQNQRIPLAIDGRGNPMQTIDNFLLIMRNDDRYAGIRYNLLTDAPEITESGTVRRWNDTDESESRRYIEKKYYLHNKEKHSDALVILMREREYHPIRDIIDAIQWDGEEHIGAFLHRWMKCEGNEYTREVGRLIFAGGINRLYHPGCKFEDMPVLIGVNQGEGKSTMVRWLAINDRYYREVTEIEGQRGMEAVEGAWICEVGELLALTKMREKDAVKAYLSKQSDTYRKPYDRCVTERQRQCVFVGTTNRSEFLTDARNRRFYPVTCHSSGYDLFDHEGAIKADILQCWAEAKAKMLRDQMPAYADRKLLPVIQEKQAEATEDDWRIGAIWKYLDPKPLGSLVCIREIKREALTIQDDLDRKQDPTPKESQELGTIMNDFTDWEKVGRTYTEKYGQQRCWKRISVQSRLTCKGKFEDVDELPEFK